MEFCQSDVFKNLFSRDPHILQEIEENMRERGYMSSHPILLAKGPWTDTALILDGHTRHEAAQNLNIEPATETMEFETEDEAIRFAIYLQKSRRNLTDADILRVVQTLDSWKTPGRPKKEAQVDDRKSSQKASSGERPENQSVETRGKSADITAKLLNVSGRTVERARAVLADDTPDQIKQAVLDNRMSIHRASKEVARLRKSQTTGGTTDIPEGRGNQQPGSPGADRSSSGTPDGDGSEDTGTVRTTRGRSDEVKKRVDNVIARIRALCAQGHQEVLDSIEEVLDAFPSDVDVAA